MFYSKSKNSWFDPSFRESYEAAGNWPDDATEYPIEKFEEVVTNRPAQKVMQPDENGVPVLVDPAAPDVSVLKSSALSAIDYEAGAARSRYITTSPGQEATYLLKSSQASAFKAAGYIGTVPGLVQAEIDATGDTAKQATDAILAQQAAWEAIAATIESSRRRGKVAVGNAVDAAGVDTARAAAIAELQAI